MTGATMKKLVGIICVVFGFAANASAASIVGTLNFGGTVTVTATEIDFQDQSGVPGLFLVGTSTGYFAGMPTGLGGEYGSSLDLTAPQQSQVAFLQDFNEQPEVPSEYDDLTFDLEDIIEPTAAPCIPGTNYTSGQSCSLGVFTLAASAGGGTTITMDIRGTFVDPTFAGGATGPARGVYTAQRTESVQSIVEIFATGPQTFTTTYSASITAVPEPATLLTFGAGTALLAAHRRRRAKKNNA